MAIVTLQSPFDTFRGTTRSPSGAAGPVLFPRGQAHYARSHLVPLNQQTTGQVLIRSYLTSVAQAYSSLTASRVEAWADASDGLYLTNPAGQRYPLTGPGLFKQINLYRLIRGLSVVEDPPTITPPGHVTGIQSAISGPGLIAITVQHTVSSGDWLLFRLTAPLTGQAQLAQPSAYRYITTDWSACFASVVGSPTNHLMADQAFDLANGDRIGIEVLPLSSAFFPGVRYRERNFPVTGI